jgi:hypothetical protein
MNYAHKNYRNYYGLALILCCAFLFYFPKVTHASSPYDQPNNTHNLPFTSDPASSLSSEIWNVTNLPSSFYINQIAVPVYNNTCLGGQATMQVYDTILGTTVGSTSSVESVTDAQQFTFNFSPPVNTYSTDTLQLELAFHCSNTNYLELGSDATSTSNYIQGVNSSIMYGMNGSNSFCGGGAGTCPTSLTDYAPQTIFNGGDVASVAFENPPFYDNFSSPDFANWWINVNIPTNSVPTTTTGWFINVNIGTSTPYGVSTDSSASIFGVFPFGGVYGNSVSSTGYLINKTSSTTIGSYEAVASIYDQSNNLLATSSVLNFTITPGLQQLVPNNNFPTNSSTPEYTAYENLLGNKVPFVYIFQILSMAQELDSTSTVSSGSTLSLTFPSFSQLHNSTTSIPFLDFSYFTTLLPSADWDTIRELDGDAEVIATAFYFFNRLKSFRHGGDSDKES